MYTINDFLNCRPVLHLGISKVLGFLMIRDTVVHAFYHFCDMSLITACAIFCSLKFHVVCTCTFFGDTIYPLKNRKMIKI
jgi:hypothetical protein